MILDCGLNYMFLLTKDHPESKKALEKPPLKILTPLAGAISPNIIAIKSNGFMWSKNAKLLLKRVKSTTN